MFEAFIDEFIPAEKLNNYLKNERITDHQVADIIFYAKAPLQRKRDALYALEMMDIPKDRRFFCEYWLPYRESVEKALSFLTMENAVFVVYEYSRYGDNIDCEEWMHGIYATYDAALECIQSDMESKKEEDLIHWYEVVLWEKGADASYNETCTYYIVDGKPCYFDLSIDTELCHSCANGELNLPVPYKPGDIMVADIYPFETKVKFVMIRTGDNRDCCCLQVLCRKRDGLWNVEALKHGIGNMYYPLVSTLYTADTYEPDLSNPEDAILARVSELIAGDEKRGSVLWEQLAYQSEMNDETVLKLIEGEKT